MQYPCKIILFFQKKNQQQAALIFEPVKVLVFDLGFV